MDNLLLLESFRRYISLTTEEEQEVLQSAIPRFFKKGDYINSEGEINRYTNFIVSGSARVYYIDAEGHEHVVQLGISKWWVGDFPSFITQTPATMFTEALEKTEILAFSYEKLQTLYQQVPKMERFFRMLIERAYAGFHKRTLQALSMDAGERYQAFLNTYPAMNQQIPQKYIASYLGMTPEFLSILKSRLMQKSRNQSKSAN